MGNLNIYRELPTDREEQLRPTGTVGPMTIPRALRTPAMNGSLACIT